MFADGEHTAEAADDGTAGQAVDQDVAPDIFQRHQSRAHQQLPQAAQRAGRLHDIRVPADGNARCEQTGEQAHGQTLNDERQGDKGVGGAHIFHDLNFPAAGKDAEADGAAHRDDADDHQHQHDAAAHLRDGLLHLHERVGHLNGSRHAVHAGDLLERLAHGAHLAQVAQRDAVVGLERIVRLKLIQQDGVIRHIPPGTG